MCVGKKKHTRKMIYNMRVNCFRHCIINTEWCNLVCNLMDFGGGSVTVKDCVVFV